MHVKQISNGMYSFCHVCTYLFRDNLPVTFHYSSSHIWNNMVRFYYIMNYRTDFRGIHYYEYYVSGFVAISVVSIDSFSEICVSNSPTLKIDSAASTGSSGRYMKCVIFSQISPTRCTVLLNIFLFSTCFGHPCSHHLEKITASVRRWYLSLCMRDVWSSGWI